MMDNKYVKTSVWLGYITGVLVLLTSIISLFFGDFYYDYVSKTRVAIYQGQDLVILLSLPLFFWSVYATARKSSNSSKLYFFWLALFGFYIYVYAMYALNGIYSDLYLFYLIILGTSFYGVLHIVAGLSHSAPVSSGKLPVKPVSIFLILVAVIQMVVWVAVLLQKVEYEFDESINAVYVLDLSFLLPAFLLAAYKLWRMRSMAYTLVPVLLIFTTIYGLAFTAGQLLKSTRDLEFSSVALYIFIIFTFLSLVFTALYLNNAPPVADDQDKKKR